MMLRLHSFIRTTAVFVCSALLPWAAIADSYQQVPPQAVPQNFSQQTLPQQALSPDQLDNLVSPIALYPDPLLGQLLAASTYPLELVEAQQWLQQNRNLQGRALEDAARQQPWDPSVQVLVAFPDVVALLNRDIRWTTDLGNAFLTQQADVMNAIQALRVQAQNNGRLATTPQQIVTNDVQNGQTAVRIEPANPQVVYPPIYDPAYVWGPSAWGAYPQVYYPGAYSGYGYGFGSGINIAGLFTGLLNWGGWGWVLGWFTHSLSLASLFFNILGFHGLGGGYGSGAVYASGTGAFTLWAHNPAHRLGVPYPRGFAGSRNSGAYTASRPGAYRPAVSVPLRSNPGVSNSVSNRGAEAWQGFGRSNYEPRGISNEPRAVSNSGYGYRSPQISAFQSNAYQNSARSPVPSTRMTTSQVSAPRYMAANPQTQHYSEPKYSAPKYSAPKYSAPKAPKYSAPKAPHFSAPKSSGGGHSSKGSHKR
jgi:hypothetical protein